MEAFNNYIISNQNLYNMTGKLCSDYTQKPEIQNEMTGYLKRLKEKYSKEYGIHIKEITNDTHKNTIDNFIEHHTNCAFLHSSGLHYTLVIKNNDKIFVMDINDSVKNNNFKKQFSNLYFLSPEIFKKPTNKPTQDEELIAPQADQHSCGIFAMKQAKNLLQNNGILLEKTIFNKTNKTAYPCPTVFKQSQSNIFLEYYEARYFDQALKNNKLNISQEKELIHNEINNYRENKCGKARILYYSIKNLPIISNKYLKMTTNNHHNNT